MAGETATSRRAVGNTGDDLGESTRCVATGRCVADGFCRRRHKLDGPAGGLSLGERIELESKMWKNVEHMQLRSDERFS